MPSAWPTTNEFPDDFPRRLERLRESLGLSWIGLARGAGLSVRALHRWRAGAKPSANHMLILIDFAAERGVLDLLLDRQGADDPRQRPLFDDDTWNRLSNRSTDTQSQRKAA